MSSENIKAPLARRDFIAAGAASLGWLAAGNAVSAAAAGPTDTQAQSDPRSAVNALVFDVFGTVVDWRSSIIREGELLGRRKGIDLDWVASPMLARRLPARDETRA
jgi:2-haloacid dehalogenase